MGMAGECKPGHVMVRDRTELTGALGGAPGKQGLVAIVNGGAESWLGENRMLVEQADSVGVVSVGESVRSTAVDSGGGAPLPHVSGVPDPTDLSTLGQTVTDHLASLSERGQTPVVVIDAIDELVESAGLESTFRMLHLLGARVESEGGRVVTVLPESLQRDKADTIAALAD